MNDKVTESEFQEIISRRSSGVIDFSQFLNELSKRGINEYEIEVATGQATYKGVYSAFKTDSQANLVVADNYNRNKVLEAIANISLPFLDFLQEIAEAGIVTYRVFIPEKKVIYLGTRGEEIEEKLKI
ncbi:Phage envelope protein [Mycobacteroides abscessus subsp. abscessus]|nr:Phage envelope protein [Mycobacteroides abscessus subsp. abscessus]